MGLMAALTVSASPTGALGTDALEADCDAPLTLNVVASRSEDVGLTGSSKAAGCAAYPVSMTWHTWCAFSCSQGAVVKLVLSRRRLRPHAVQLAPRFGRLRPAQRAHQHGGGDYHPKRVIFVTEE